MRRRVRFALAALTLAGALVAVAGITLTEQAPRPAAAAALRSELRAASTDLDVALPALQERLQRLPGDWQAWAVLGAGYTEQARRTADPTYYGRAEGALRRSLAVQPVDNSVALTGLAALATARHDFAAALDFTEQSRQINRFSSTNEGVRADALVELGRYDEAFAGFQRMVDLKPGVASYARASYAFELRGDVAGARQALERAREVASSPADRGFASFQLGELAWQTGDLAAARAGYDSALAADPSYPAPLVGRARVAAARGDVDAAVRDYAEAVARLPLSSYVIEYAELLEALGRGEQAREQYALVRVQQQLFAAAGVDVDLEIALFEADHGDPAAALRAAQTQYDGRRSVLVEDALAWSLHVAGRDAEALRHAQAAVRLGTPYASLFFHKGVIEHRLGRYDDARRDLQRALELNPHFSALHAPTARRILADLP